LQVLDLFNRLEEGAAVDQLVKDHTQTEHAGFFSSDGSSQNFGGQIETVSLISLVDDMGSKLDGKFVKMPDVEVVEINVAW
jgi:hypothetical protein